MKLGPSAGLARGALVLAALCCVECDWIKKLTGPTTPLAIQSFTASPSVGLSPGGQTSLSWAVEGADSVEIDNGLGQVGAKGNRTVPVQWTTTFTLTAKGAGTSAHAATLVQVIPPNPTSRPIFVPVPGATPTPAPPPTTTPGPAPTPTPTPAPPGGAVARVHIGVLYLVCGEQGVPDSMNATQVAVGCKVHLDMNLKDSRNKPTSPRGPQTWHYSNQDLIRMVDDDPWSPIILALAPGNLAITAEVDGVQSNEVDLQFY